MSLTLKPPGQSGRHFKFRVSALIEERSKRVLPEDTVGSWLASQETETVQTHVRHIDFNDSSADKENVNEDNNAHDQSKEVPAKVCTSGSFMESPIKERTKSVINVGPFRTLALQYEEISSKLDFIVSRLQLLQSKISPDEAVLERPQGMPAFSLKTEEAFNAMEQFLSKDENFRLTMLYFQAQIDGQENATKAGMILLKRTISNALSRIISFKGTRGLKLAFCDSRLLECILCAVKAVFKKLANLAEIQRSMSRWFATSDQRKLSEAPSQSKQSFSRDSSEPKKHHRGDSSQPKQHHPGNSPQPKQRKESSVKLTSKRTD